MSIRVKCFGGSVGWKFKMRFPKLASEAFIKSNFLLRRKTTKRYIEWFMKQDTVPQPKIVCIETINRCNNTCAFCPANKNNDKRPYAKMSQEMFMKIVEDLRKWNYQGIVSLYINNEPFVDDRIIELHEYVKENLPQCKVKFFTNALLMDLQKFLEIIPYIDYMVINNYGEEMKLHQNVDEIYQYVKMHEANFANKEIIINIRYIKDVLMNRAGGAPNKKATKAIIHEPCLFPYTDMAIFANGNVGICCNDATEKTNLGNVMQDSLKDLWENEREGAPSCALIRRKMARNRAGWDFCKHCDTMDSGLRIRISADELQNEK